MRRGFCSPAHWIAPCVLLYYWQHKIENEKEGRTCLPLLVTAMAHVRAIRLLWSESFYGLFYHSEMGIAFYDFADRFTFSTGGSETWRCSSLGPLWLPCMTLTIPFFSSVFIWLQLFSTCMLFVTCLPLIENWANIILAGGLCCCFPLMQHVSLCFPLLFWYHVYFTYIDNRVY